MLSVDIKSKTFIHKTGGIFQRRDYFPGQTNLEIKKKGMTSGSAIFEQHAMVHWSEEVGLNMIGYDAVNVAQKIILALNGNNLSVTGSTDVFPSATLMVNKIQLFKYDQPSFKATHGRSSSFGGDNGMGGVDVLTSPRRPAPSFCERYNK